MDGKSAGRGFFPKVFVIGSKETEEEGLLREAFGIGVRSEEGDSAGCMYTAGSEVAVAWFSLKKKIKNYVDILRVLELILEL